MSAHRMNLRMMIAVPYLRIVAGRDGSHRRAAAAGPVLLVP
jgi:hypothetical protein